ncbi:hypothetical protein [Haloarchaeobius sp. HME9146]|uniref:hypothetical protein n=1 Tax=Haloarchaeobius sp. HME9146 TaxID=2978732 RepID=UPI0021C0DC7D|nr:hypothetical protein [Haloarchaeobius sp. HME9146]MCT9096541.1 hypothetical protein [Haloarchaeobius sp. HME9146]
MKDKRSVSRRQLLYTLGGVSAITAAVGATGTTARLLDAERLGGAFTTGGLDLDICWQDGQLHAENTEAESETEEDAKTTEVIEPGFCPEFVNGSIIEVQLPKIDAENRTGSGSARVRLPDDGHNNVAWLWFRTSCPESPCTQVGDYSLANLYRALDLRVFYDVDCDGEPEEGETVTIAEGTLCEVLSELHSGVRLDSDLSSADEIDSFTPGQEVCIGFEWELTADICIEGGSEASFSLEFYAEQARHNMAMESPWDDECTVRCDEVCQDCVQGKGISFVAFCVEDGEPLQDGDVCFGVTGTNSEGEPTRLAWYLTQAAQDRGVDGVDYTVLKTGNGPMPTDFAIENFYSNSGVEGYVTIHEGTPGTGDQLPQSPCKDGHTGIKYDYEPGFDSPNDPCVPDDWEFSETRD